MLESLHKYGFAVIKNCKPNLKSVNKIANKIGYVRNSIFGGLWTFESDNKKADSAYSQEELRPHTDSTYSNDAPGLQLLLCCKYNAKGGASIMVDGLSIARELKKNHQKLFKTLTEIVFPFSLNYSTETYANILLAKMNLTKLYLKVFHFLKFCP